MPALLSDHESVDGIQTHCLTLCFHLEAVHNQVESVGGVDAVGHCKGGASTALVEHLSDT